MKQISSHIFTGLQLDTAVSKCNSQYLIDAHNIRITAREGETLLSVTNEKGPMELILKSEGLNNNATISGLIVGHCVLNSYLVLFTHDDDYGDKILRVDMSTDNPTVAVLFPENDDENILFLGFDPEHPIEAVGDYENENILKVYWTDGINLPRIINIMHPTYKWDGAFDFTPELTLNETVTITRNTSASGMFPTGVILYAFTYYNKYGQETNVFHTTPLYYTSFYDRGGSPELTVSNAFTIEVNGVDTHFDYLRIYSIIRTSIDAIPTVKVIQDIALDSISENRAIYTDTGTNGYIVDPTHLLYVGGELILAETLCHKDGTLFLGGIKIDRPVIPNDIKALLQQSKSNHSFATTERQSVTLQSVNIQGTYIYANGLNTLAAGFKNREYYRLGVQFQFKNGKWSEPCWIGDYQVNSAEGPTLEGTTLNKLIINYTLPTEALNSLRELGYKKHRPLVVFPKMLDRTILAQGVVNATMATSNHLTKNKDLYGQSSWFFRPISPLSDDNLVSNDKTVIPAFSGVLPYINKDATSSSTDDLLRRLEIQGFFGSSSLYSAAPNKFKVQWDLVTFHSPETTFDDSLANVDLANLKCRKVGYADIIQTLSDIDILTSSPTISNSGSGFIHKSFISDGAFGIVSGLFYDDYVVDDTSDDGYRGYNKEHNSVKWMVYPWQLNGSINNDCNRPADKGIRSAELKKKIISNLRYSTTAWMGSIDESELILTYPDIYVPLLFLSDLVSIVKLGDKVYQGNIDTLLTPEESDGTYFAFGRNSTDANPNSIEYTNTINTAFESTAWWKTFSLNDDTLESQGLYRREKVNGSWQWVKKDKNIGDKYLELSLRKDNIRMKYKSTPHIVLLCPDNPSIFGVQLNRTYLPIVELYKSYDLTTAFGGLSPDALRANLWIPAGEALAITTSSLNYIWGDTWFSRYDCLKTYPFTNEDPNLIVEIGSFMLETHINIDGRYDRNRGLVNNLNMSPLNFNLYNPVYTQENNFFNYRILDNDYYELNSFPNQITWSTEKTAGADVDPWTSITLASTYDMDGSKGKILALNVWKDVIYCFLDNGISLILFNSRVLIPTSDNVPIEITNSYKVDGKRYISDGTGCLNKYSICNTPAAIYFIDSVSEHLYSIGDNGMMDLSATKNMTSWFKTIDSSKWTANNFSTRIFHDSNHSDLYIVTEDECLCFNEILGEFTSYMSYYDIPIMFNVIDKFFCVKDNYINKMFSGDYGYFFGSYEPYDFTFVVNGTLDSLGAADKTFTNIDFRADRWSDELDGVLSSESPFDYIRAWDEYQDTGEVLLKDIKSRPSNLKKKFRTWRVNIPRDAHNRRDRIRNTWCKVKIGSAPRYRNGNDGFIQLHDLNTTYYI